MYYCTVALRSGREVHVPSVNSSVAGHSGLVESWVVSTGHAYSEYILKSLLCNNLCSAHFQTDLTTRELLAKSEGMFAESFLTR